MFVQWEKFGTTVAPRALQIDGTKQNGAMGAQGETEGCVCVPLSFLHLTDFSMVVVYKAAIYIYGYQV